LAADVGAGAGAALVLRLLAPYAVNLAMNLAVNLVMNLAGPLLLTYPEVRPMAGPNYGWSAAGEESRAPAAIE